MDSNTRLDYALFQLTPTRTRCDLVLFAGKKSEKLASGLLQPFISHLIFAKDEILKGGYSITLRPPTESDSVWFTKSTFQRFVRFVSNPEVLERFVNIEKEIIHIEDSIKTSELAPTNGVDHSEEGSPLPVNDYGKKSTDSLKLKSEIEETDDAGQEENSKIRLQRLLNTRRVYLRKEQGMAYARALAAGFELDGIVDLISFADSFRAFRLREACINFKELCKKKHADSVWMDELAAIKAYTPSELSYVGTSGIILSNENLLNGGVSLENKEVNISPDQTPATIQLPMPWTNQIPPYMYNFQNQVPQMSPSGGYPFPVMHPVTPYYPGNMQWHPSMGQAGHSLVKTSSRKKEKSSNGESSETYEEDTHSKSSDSNSDSDSNSYTRNEKNSTSDDHSHKKKHKKKSSRQVVIRNINYITSSKTKDGLDKNGVSDGSSSLEDEIIDGKVHKRESRNKLHGAAESDHDTYQTPYAAKGDDKNESWNAFQNLLMRSEEQDTRSINMESEKFTRRKTVSSDSFVATERHGENEARRKSDYFENGDAYRSGIKKGGFAGEEMLISRRFDGLKSTLQDTISDCSNESSIIKSRKEDWFVADGFRKSENRDKINAHKLFGESNGLSEVNDRYSKTSREFEDDSFMIQSKLINNDSNLRTDLSMVLDLNLATKQEKSTSNTLYDKNGVSSLYKSDDLYMLPERDVGSESTGTHWSPKMDYGVEMSFESEKRLTNISPNNVGERLSSNHDTPISKKKEVGKKVPMKDGKPKPSPGSAGRNRMEMKSKQPLPKTRTVVQKSKFEKEEEARKKMEELLIQRQKRIAERSAAASGLTREASKKVLPQSKSTKTQYSTGDSNRFK